MTSIINYEDLPLENKLYNTASPNKQAFEELKAKKIFKAIEEECKTKKDLEKAVSGAFIGYHIINHLINNSYDPVMVETMFIEMLGTYEIFDKEINKSPCWKFLKLTLQRFGFEEFYQKGIDYIIENKGKVD